MISYFFNMTNDTNSRLKVNKGDGRSVPHQGSPSAKICGYFKED